MNLREKAPLWPISLSRIMIGVLWLYSLRWKLPPDFTAVDGKGLIYWLELEAQYPAFEIYGDFVSSVVIPNFTLFAWIIFVAELLVGLSLLTGTFTRLGGLVGLLMALNLAVGLLEVPNEWPWSYIMLIMWHGTFVVTAAGRTLGVDSLLFRRFPRRRILQWVA